MDLRKQSLLGSHDYYCFLAGCNELKLWLNRMDKLNSRKDVAKDLIGAESLLQTHQVK